MIKTLICCIKRNIVLLERNSVMNSISFSSNLDFIQAAFNKVAKIVAEHGHPCLDACCPAESTERCLEHLAVVASDWSYDYSLIDAHLETYKKANAEIREYLGE
ncbi:hypothetical protein ABUW_1985 [Acinetobacter baumannii]|uniref:Uncharacterized protein n=2 Tax=Acinetobacter baumannii TaxID=470 RepID=A0A0D5YHC7_ACIBA|nr:hypothetical protein ABUW_1985 [Acinetobacter baumannii]